MHRDMVTAGFVHR